VEDRNGLVTAWVTNDGSLREGEGAMSRTSEPTGDGAGLGLRATRHRLEREYGAAATLELSPSMVDGGDRVTATVCWPAPDPVEGSADGVLP
jgi:LytS/YehU family sensor histidine kinase